MEEFSKYYYIYSFHNTIYADVAECISDADCDEKEVCMDGDCEGN